MSLQTQGKEARIEYLSTRHHAKNFIHISWNTQTLTGVHAKQLTHAPALWHIDIQMGQPSKFTEPLFERIKSVPQTLK